MDELFGIKVYLGGMESLLLELQEKEEKVHVISGNAEVFKYPLSDCDTLNQFKDSRNIVIPDGISVYLPIKKRKNKEIKRLTGIDLMQKLLEQYEKNGKKVYFLGAKQEVLDEMLVNVKKDYPKLNIVGHHHGYININNCENVIEDIKRSVPDTIFVAMGTPIQEKFIFKYIDELPCSLYMGVGGSFDVLSGKINRCPQWVSKIGMEWLYRMIKDPSKIVRLWNNLFFVVKGLLFG